MGLHRSVWLEMGGVSGWWLAKTPNKQHRLGLCSREEPFLKEALERVLRDSAGPENVGGLSKPCDTLRSEFANYTVSTDKFNTQSDQKVVYHTTCSKAHRGLCRVGTLLFSSRRSGPCAGRVSISQMGSKK